MRGSSISRTFIDGTRANSYNTPIRLPKQARTEEKTERMASLIPYWPQTISYASLSQLTGLSKDSLEGRIASCQNKFLIFNDDDGSLSRLKYDRSNCI